MNKGERADAVNGGLTLLQNEGHLAFGTDALLLSAFVIGAILSERTEFHIGVSVYFLQEGLLLRPSRNGYGSI